ncbi:hypothetical protein BKA57DRAFT_472453 [Linnemannia elongata]|nr:hypothetical protein BKA57DRAFT_472453 [Linnemannia elongata]
MRPSFLDSSLFLLPLFSGFTFFWPFTHSFALLFFSLPLSPIQLPFLSLSFSPPSHLPLLFPPVPSLQSPRPADSYGHTYISAVVPQDPETILPRRCRTSNHPPSPLRLPQNRHIFHRSHRCLCPLLPPLGPLFGKCFPQLFTSILQVHSRTQTAISTLRSE